MPLYDYRCSERHHFEAFASMQDCEQPQPCPECGAAGERIFVAMPPRDYLETLYVWKRPDGTYTLPAKRDARMPEGFELMAVRETHEKRRVEREMAREERETWQRHQIKRDMELSEAQRHNRAELRQFMQQGGMIETESGDRRQIGPMSAQQRDFARFAMESNNHRPQKSCPVDFVIEALSMDASNREHGRNDDGTRVRK